MFSGFHYFPKKYLKSLIPLNDFYGFATAFRGKKAMVFDLCPGQAAMSSAHLTSYQSVRPPPCVWHWSAGESSGWWRVRWWFLGTFDTLENR